MNHSFKNPLLPGVTLVCGSVGLLLQMWLYSTKNSLGFIQRGHISQMLLFLLTGAFLLALFLVTRTIQQANKYEFNFPASPVSAIGSMLAGLGIGMACGMELVAVGDDRLGLVTAMAGLLAAIGLLWSAKCRWEGSVASVLCHGSICVWLMLRLLSLYRLWSAEPQLENYFFQLMAMTFAMGAAYHRAAFSQGLGSRAKYGFFALAGLYCCCLCLAEPESMLPYLSLGLWLVTDLCDLTPMPGEKRSKIV